MPETSDWSTTDSGNENVAGIDWRTTAARVTMLSNGKALMAQLRRWMNNWRLGTDSMSDAQRTDTGGFTGAVDVTTPVTTQLTAGWTANQDVKFPAGLYTVSNIALPGTAATRYKAFAVHGQGTGEIFARGLSGGTILQGNSGAASVVSYTPDVANTGQGTLDFAKFRIEANSTVPAVNFGALYSQSEFHHNAIYQGGTGDGFSSQLSNTVDIHHNYSINSLWNTVSSGSRTGAGFRVTQSLPGGTGLTTLRKNTSRGYKYGFVFGDGTNPLYAHKLTESETSVVENGVWVRANANKTIISDNYLEGGDAGTGIIDDGNYTVIRDNLIFAGFTKHIDCTGFTYGNHITGNVLSAGSVANTVLIDVTSTGANGGPGKIVTGNTLTFSGSGGSIAGVVGLRINGIDPRIDFHGNVFDPRGPWVGGAGTKKIDNQSTSSDGTTGTGVYGLGIAQDIAGNIESPYVGRGAVNKKVDPTVLTNSYLSSAGALTLGELSVFTVTFSSSAAVTEFAAPNLPDKTFEIHITNALCTLTNGTKLKLQGGANYTPPAGGSWHSFQIKPGGVAWETSRNYYSS